MQNIPILIGIYLQTPALVSDRYNCKLDIWSHWGWLQSKKMCTKSLREGYLGLVFLRQLLYFHRLLVCTYAADRNWVNLNLNWFNLLNGCIDKKITHRISVFLWYRNFVIRQQQQSVNMSQKYARVLNI